MKMTEEQLAHYTDDQIRQALIETDIDDRTISAVFLRLRSGLNDHDQAPTDQRDSCGRKRENVEAKRQEATAMPTKPITPQEIASKHQVIIPDEVIEAFNELIAENWRPTLGQSHFLQKDVVARVLEKMTVQRSVIFASKWLDVEKVYGHAGWEVQYDAPAYCESFPESFTFTYKGR